MMIGAFPQMPRGDITIIQSIIIMFVVALGLIVSLAVMWLRRERRRDEEVATQLREVWQRRICVECGWEGQEEDCGFGHKDFICPACSRESLVHEADIVREVDGRYWWDKRQASLEPIPRRCADEHGNTKG